MTYVHSRALPAPSAALETRLALAALVLFALLIRVAVIAATVGFDTPPTAERASDSRIHAALVENLLSGRGYSLNKAPTAVTPPLYVFFLAGMYGLFDSPAPLRLAQAVLGAIGCLVLFFVGRRIFDPITAGLASVGLALYPLTAYIAGLHLTENLFLFLLLLLLWQAEITAERPTTLRAAAMGALVGLAALTRAVFLAFVPFLFLWSSGVWGIRSRTGYRVFAVAAITAALVLTPWTVRNYLVLDAFVPIQSNGGMVFWTGNNAHANGGMVMPNRMTWTDGAPPDDGMSGWRNLTIAQENARYLHAAVSWIRENPGEYTRLLPRKLLRLYGFSRAADENSVDVPVLVALAQLVVYAGAVSGLILLRSLWRRATLLVLPLAFVNLMTLLFSGATRYTIPMVPSLLLFAAFAASQIYARLTQAGASGDA